MRARFAAYAKGGKACCQYIVDTTHASNAALLEKGPGGYFADIEATCDKVVRRSVTLGRLSSKSCYTTITLRGARHGRLTGDDIYILDAILSPTREMISLMRFMSLASRNCRACYSSPFTAAAFRLPALPAFLLFLCSPHLVLLLHPFPLLAVTPEFLSGRSVSPAWRSSRTTSPPSRTRTPSWASATRRRSSARRAGAPGGPRARARWSLR